MNCKTCRKKPAVPGKTECHACRKAVVRANDPVKYHHDNMVLNASRAGHEFKYPLSKYRNVCLSTGRIVRLLRKDKDEGFTVKNLEVR